MGAAQTELEKLREAASDYKAKVHSAEQQLSANLAADEEGDYGTQVRRPPFDRSASPSGTLGLWG